MKRNIYSRVLAKGVFAGVLLLACGLSPAARGADAGDNQAWIQFWGSANITDVLDVKLTREDRFMDSGEDKYYYGYTEVSLPVKLTDHWSFAPAIRTVRTLRGGEWRDDLMSHINLISKTKLDPVVLKNRMRLAKINKESTDTDPLEYEHRLDVVAANGWGGWKVKPYVAEEVFYDFDKKDINRFRTSSGLLFSPAKKVSLDLYVLREDMEKDSEWSDILVFGLASGLEF